MRGLVQEAGRRPAGSPCKSQRGEETPTVGDLGANCIRYSLSPPGIAEFYSKCEGIPMEGGKQRGHNLIYVLK